MFTLAADLDCGTVSPALTVRDGAHLDLGGHKLSTFNTAGSVILMDGQGAVVTNGIVHSLGTFGGEGVEVAGEGGHTVRRVSVFARFCILVTSDQNRVMNNVAIFAGGVGIVIRGNQNQLTSNWVTGHQAGIDVVGDDNRLVENTISEVARQGFTVVGDRNLLLRNTAASLFEYGFSILGDGNRLVGNLALDTADEGIVVSGHETVILGNTALDNGTDLIDTNEDCDNNRWAQNVFETGLAGATENPACIQGQPPQASDVVQLP